jgi:anti-anti-sigma factor
VGRPPTPRADELGRGSHVCWPYRSADAHVTFLTEFFAAGMEANERLLYLAPPEQIQTTCDSLAGAGLDLGTLMWRGAFSVGDVTEAYLSGGSLQPEVRLAGQAVLVQQALDDGFAGLRVCSEIAPLLAHGGAGEEWCGYELRADVLIAGLPSVVVCACDVRQADEAVVSDVAAVHSMAAGVALRSPSPFRLHAAPGGLALSGEVDASSAERLGHWLRGALADLAEPVVDVAGLEFVDAAGMWALLDSAHAHRDGLDLRGTSPHFRRVWSVCGYDTIGSVRLN